VKMCDFDRKMVFLSHFDVKMCDFEVFYRISMVAINFLIKIQSIQFKFQFQNSIKFPSNLIKIPSNLINFPSNFHQISINFNQNRI
jgi:hypothetical protein